MKKVEVTTKIQTTPEQVLNSFTNPEMLKDWWDVERSLIDKRSGGLYTLSWNISEKGIGYVSSGIIRNYVKDKELIIDNLVYLNPEKPFLGPMSLTIKAIKKDNLTEVYLCQDGYQAGKDWNWYYEAVKKAWPQVLQELKKYLELNNHTNKNIKRI
ncbi:MAG TPA: SRPBCC family protein [Ignavibacteriaceae bacterium]|nr:SRPBCC family protein [Ignavibacteriaceae bacterium]